MRPAPSDGERLRRQLEIERRMAARLRGARRNERRRLYRELYEELFREVADHSQLARRADPAARERALSWKRSILAPFITRQTRFVEIGAGDCSLSLEVASRVRSVVALDVSDRVSRQRSTPGNFERILTDGLEIPVSPGSIDLAFSNQLMEHLHPDDAREQLGNVYRALAPGGRYLCITPNRLSGPHDVSRHFSRVAEGLHLKEYTYRELAALFRRVGFGELRALFRARDLAGRPLRLALPPVMALERLLDLLPAGAGRAIARRAPARGLLGVMLLGARSEGTDG